MCSEHIPCGAVHDPRSTASPQRRSNAAHAADRLRGERFGAGARADLQQLAARVVVAVEDQREPVGTALEQLHRRPMLPAGVERDQSPSPRDSRGASACAASASKSDETRSLAAGGSDRRRGTLRVSRAGSPASGPVTERRKCTSATMAERARPGQESCAAPRSRRAPRTALAPPGVRAPAAPIASTRRSPRPLRARPRRAPRQDRRSRRRAERDTAQTPVDPWMIPASRASVTTGGRSSSRTCSETGSS